MSEYLEREALLNEIRMASTLKECVAIVRRFPAADVEPVKHGEWVSCEESDEFPCSYRVYRSSHRRECSVCGFTPQLNYCPNCGAKMDGCELDEHPDAPPFSMDKICKRGVYNNAHD